jgi:hypothetical protein
LGLHARGAPLRFPPARDQTRALEHLQVPRNRGQTDRERLGDLVDGGLALGQVREDRAPRGVGKRGERAGEVVGLLFTYWLSN